MSDLLKILRKRNKFSIKAEGKSMLPILHPEDLVYFRKIPLQKIRVNDIILVFKNKTSFIHRVIYKKQDAEGKIKYVIAKGDNNRLSDGKIHEHQIYGLAYQIRRKGKLSGIDDLYLIQSSIYFREILKIKKAFEKARLDFVFLKGLPVHLYHEGTHPRRVYADCDILVTGKEKNKILRILKSYGYKLLDPAYSAMHKKLKDKVTELSFHKQINSYPVVFDIHFEPVFMMNQIGVLEAIYPEKLLQNMTAIFLKEKKFISIQNIIFPVLSSDNMITYLSLHIFHHNFKEIYRFDLLDNIMKKRYDKKNNSFTSLLVKINYFKLNNFIYPSICFLHKYYFRDIYKKLLNYIQPDKSAKKYADKFIININVFDSENRIKAGVVRFWNLFCLSPNPIYRKIAITINIQVLYSLFWVARSKSIRFLKGFSFLPNH